MAQISPKQKMMKETAFTAKMTMLSTAVFNNSEPKLKEVDCPH
jgi:hypothetical protein